MNDQELIAKINATVRDLNELLFEAMKARLEYDAELLDARRFGGEADSVILYITKFRRVIAL